MYESNPICITVFYSIALIFTQNINPNQMKDGAGTRKVTFIEQVYEDGELVRGRKIEKLPKEPHFVKLYLKDLAHLRELPGWVCNILHELLKKMDYTNEIVLNSTVKNRMALELNIHPKTIDNALTKFVDKKILSRVGKGVFLANPFIFGRGTWAEVEEIRMTVSYRANGEKDVQADILDGTDLVREEAMADEREMNAGTYSEERKAAEKERVKSTRLRTTPSKKKKPNLDGVESLFEMAPAS